MTRLLAALGLVLMAAPVGAGPIQGPVRGVVEVADGAQVSDIVVYLGCRTHGIHSSSWPADDVTRIVASGESFLIPWAYRGLSPAGCTLNVYHPRYVVARRRLDDQFSQQFGLIRLQSWDAFMGEGPKPPPMPSHYPWPKTEFISHWKTAAALLARGAAPPKLDGTYPPVVSAMCSVSAQGDSTSLRVFLDAGVSPNIAESSGFSPLMCAARNNQLEAARMLINAGADVNARASHNRTALGLSKAGRYDALVQVLKDAGARE